MTPDPAGLAAVDLTSPQSLNRYAYVMNNPTSLVDFLGLWCDMKDSLCPIYSPRYQMIDRLSGGGGGDYSCRVEGHAADCGMVQWLVASGLAYPVGCVQRQSGTVECQGVGGLQDPEDPAGRRWWRWDPTMMVVQSGDQAVLNQAALAQLSKLTAANNNPQQTPKIEATAIKAVCGSSFDSRVLRSIRNGAVTGGATGAYTGFVSGTILFGTLSLGTSGPGGAAVGGVVGGIFGASRGVFVGFALAEACQAAGAYKSGG